MTSSRPAPKAPIRNVPAPQGKPSVYSRFIPREELADFAAWTPGAFDAGTPSASAAAPRGTAPATDGQPTAPPAAASEEVQSLVRAARQQAYQDGYRDGLVALDAFKQSHARQVAAQIGALLQGTGEQLDLLQQQMAQALASAATNLARQVVRSELQTRPELVARVASEALETLLLSARHITLRVHPDDQPVVAEGAADVLAARGGRIVADASLARGGCLIESDIGSVDASMSSRWRQAVAEFGAPGEWHDDAAADADATEPPAAAAGGRA